MDDRERNPDRGDPGCAGRDASPREPQPNAAQVSSTPQGAGHADPAAERTSATPAAQETQRAAEVVYLRDRRAKCGSAAKKARRTPRTRTLPGRYGSAPWPSQPAPRERGGWSTPSRPERVSSTEPLAHNAWGESVRAGRSAGAGSFLYTLLTAFERLVRKLQGAPLAQAGASSGDWRIRLEIHERFVQQGSLDPSGIDIEVASGEVTLRGTAESRHDKYVAEEIADDVSGVVGVHNQLRVRERASILPFSRSGAKREPHKSGPTSNRNVRR